MQYLYLMVPISLLVGFFCNNGSWSKQQNLNISERKIQVLQDSPGHLHLCCHVLPPVHVCPQAQVCSRSWVQQQQGKLKTSCLIIKVSRILLTFRYSFSDKASNFANQWLFARMFWGIFVEGNQIYCNSMRGHRHPGLQAGQRPQQTVQTGGRDA